MTFRPEDPKHVDLEAMTKDIKGLDEVWEILASVPWLDDSEFWRTLTVTNHPSKCLSMQAISLSWIGSESLVQNEFQ